MWHFFMMSIVYLYGGEGCSPSRYLWQLPEVRDEMAAPKKTVSHRPTRLALNSGCIHD